MNKKSKKHKQTAIPMGEPWMRKRKQIKEFQEKRRSQILYNQIEKMSR